MKRLKISSLYDSLHFLLFFVVLLILSLKYWYLFPILFIYIVFIIKKTELISFCLFLGILIIISSLQYIPVNKDELSFKGVIVEINDKSIVVKNMGRKYLIYCDEKLSIGDIAEVKIEKTNSKNELFDYSEYLLNNSIYGPYKLIKIEVLGNRFVINKIHSFFVNKLDEHPSIYKGYIKSLIFADSTNIKEIKDKSNKIGISHILAVSGMHLSLLIMLIEFVLKKVFYFQKYIDASIIVFLLSYIIITNFSITVLRAALFVIFKKIFTINKLLFTKLDILSIAGLILLIIRPNYLFLLSFQLSFLVSFILITFTSNFEFKSKIIELYFIGIIAFLVGLPLIVKQNFEFNLLSIICGPFYVLFFELLLYPITLLMFIFPSLHELCFYIYDFFEITVIFLSNIKMFNVIVGDINIIIILIYYVLLFLLLSSFEVKRCRKYFSIIFLLFMIVVYNKNSFNQIVKIKFYNVGQGESILIFLPKDKYVLIDAYDNIDEFLKRDGVRKIDILLITHGHADHSNSFPLINETFKVNNIYSSLYDESLILKDNKIKRLRSDDKVFIEDAKIHILGPIHYYQNENNNSLVFKFIYKQISCLFTGDIEEEAEKDLVNKYGDYLSSDILKVPHHGSKSSSSKLFIKSVNPTYMVVSVGINNIYDLPNNNLILSFKNLYRTDLHGTITITYRKKIKIKYIFR